MPGKREKVLFLDIDEVFTTAGKPEERKTVGEAVARLVKARKVGYTRFAFITARSGHWVLREFLPYLEKYGLLGNSTIHCENGLYEIANGKFVLGPEARQFMQVREMLSKEIQKEIKKQKIPAIDAAEKLEKVVQARFETKEGQPSKALQDACTKVINKLKKSGKIPETIGIDITKSGINIFPRNVTKGTTARAIERRILVETGRKVRGKAIGDRPKEDGLMAKGKQIKWHPVSGVKQFNRLMDNLTFRRRNRRRR